jgi:hypothetical protein
MARQIALDRFTSELYPLLEETFERVQGIYLDKGTSLFETLATVSAEEASRPASATCASIAAQVEHVRFYLEVIERYMRGETVGQVDWPASWRLTSVTPEEWTRSGSGSPRRIGASRRSCAASRAGRARTTSPARSPSSCTPPTTSARSGRRSARSAARR